MLYAVLTNMAQRGNYKTWIIHLLGYSPFWGHITIYLVTQLSQAISSFTWLFMFLKTIYLISEGHFNIYLVSRLLTFLKPYHCLLGYSTFSCHIIIYLVPPHSEAISPLVTQLSQAISSFTWFLPILKPYHHLLGYLGHIIIYLVTHHITIYFVTQLSQAI